jgi:hypothetical protein
VSYPSAAPAAPSRAPRRGFFALALLLPLTWAAETAEREGLRRAALTYDLGTLEAAMNVITGVDVLVGLATVVSLLLLCLAPRSARVTLPAQVAATLRALEVLVRGGVRLLLASGAFAVTATFSRYGGVAVTLADMASGALLLVVILRVARAARAPAASALAILGLVLLLVRLVAYSLAAFAGAPSATPDPLDLVQLWSSVAAALLTLWLCLRAGVLVARIPDDLAPGSGVQSTR